MPLRFQGEGFNEIPKQNLNAMTLINHEKVRKFVAHDPTLLPTLCESVRELLPEALEKLQAGIDAADPSVISNALHTIKGRFGYFFCEEPAKFAQDADSRARSGDIQNIEFVAQRLNEYAEQFFAEIDSFIQSDGQSE